MINLNDFVDNNLFLILLILFLLIWSSYKKLNSYKFISSMTIIFLIPLTITILIKIIILYLPGNMVGSYDGWLSFLGGYIGALLALSGIYFQFHEDSKRREVEEVTKENTFKKKQLDNYKTLLKYLLQIININLKYLDDNNDKLNKSYSFHILFTRRSEFLNFFILNKKIIENNLVNFIEYNHTSILILDDILNQLKLESEDYYSNLSLKKNWLDDLSKIIENYSDTSKFKYISNILKNFKRLSLYFLKNSSKEIILFDSKNHEVFIQSQCFINNYCFLAFDNTSGINANNYQDLFFLYYSEIFNLLAALAEQHQNPKIKVLLQTGLSIYSIEYNKKETIKKYSEALNNCKNDINSFN